METVTPGNETVTIGDPWVPKVDKVDKDSLKKVAKKYHAPKPDEIQSFKKRGFELRYTSHATVTKILNEIDISWTMEPLMQDGVPFVDDRNGMFTMYGHLTVLGKRVFCVGSCDNTKADWAKELYGDMIRNGAMRLGIHIDLWDKDFPETTTTAKRAVSGRKAVDEKISAKPIESGEGAKEPAEGKGVASAVEAAQDALGAQVVEYTCGGQPERFTNWPAIDGCGKKMTDVDGNLVMRTKTYLCSECSEKWVASIGGKK